MRTSATKKDAATRKYIKRGSVPRGKIIELYTSSGLSISQIAMQLGMSESNVRYHLDKNGVGHGDWRAIKPTDIDVLLGMYKSGKSVSNIAQTFQVSTRIVRHHLVKNGLLEVQKRMWPKIPKEVSHQFPILYNEGCSMSQIADKLGVAQSSVRRHLKLQGVTSRPARNPRTTPENITEMWEKQYINGETLQQISNQHGVNNTTVYSHLVKRGVKMRSKKVARHSKPHLAFEEPPYQVCQVIIGSVLGDGFLSHSSLSIVHAESQLDYLRYKAELLGEYVTEAGVKRLKEAGVDKRGWRHQAAWELRTVCCQYISGLRQISYVAGGRTIRRIIPQIGPLALAILWGDDGNFAHTYGTLCVDNFREDEVKDLARYMADTFNIDCKAVPTPNYSKMYWRIRVSAAGMKTLRSVIGTYLPDSMLYKLGIGEH